MCLKRLAAIVVWFLFCAIWINMSYPKGMDKTKLVGNIYGIVKTAEAEIGLKDAEIFLFEKPLSRSVDDISPSFDSDKGRFALPDFVSAKLKTTTNSEGKFLINNIPTPFPGKKYTILAKASGFTMEIVDQAFVTPGASMSLRVEFVLSKQDKKVVVYYPTDQNAPISIGRRIDKTVIKDLSQKDYQIYATREGLVGYTTANGHVIQPYDHFVALPSSKALCSLDGHEFEVELKYGEKTAIEPVWDIGPWNIHDNYWDPEVSREIYSALQQYWQTHNSPKEPLPPDWDPESFPVPPPFTPIGQGMPESQKAYETSAIYTPNSYNYGCDEFGRHKWYPPAPLNPAGIDLADGTFWDSLGMIDNDWIKVKYLWVEPPPPTLADWPFHQRDLQNSGNNPEALGIRNPKLDEGLTIEGTSAYSQPIVEGHMVYLATMDGKVIASDMERKLCPWFFDTGAEEIKLTPALFGNKLYVLDSNNVLWCLDKRNGNWIWYFDIIDYFGLPDYYWQTSPQVWQNNYVCMTIGPYAVFVYDDIEIASKSKKPKIAKLAKLAKTPIQAQSEPAEFVATSVISEDGVFYCFNFACQAIAFRVTTGEYLWHISEFPGPKDPAGLTYLGNPFAIVLAEDVLILKNNWRFDFQDTVPKPGETGFLYAIDIKAHDKILWAKEIGLTSCPSVFKDNALYSYGLFAPQEPGKIEGVVYCLDPKTGQLLTDNAISVNDDVHISIGGDILYLTCWTFKKAFAVIFEPFEILWQQDLAYHPFSAIVPVEDRAYISMLDIELEIQGQKATLWPDAKTRPLATGSLILTSFSEEPPPPVYQKGDVSMDGNITAHDAKLIMEHVVGQIKLTPEQLELADVSGNGQVSAYDAGLVMQITTGLKKGVKK